MSKKTGRPTRYKAEYAEQAEKLCKTGFTDVQLADFFNVSEVTLNAWKKAHPIFLKSLKAGKDFNDDLVEESLFKRAMGGQEIVETTVETSPQGEKTKITKKITQGSDTAAIFWLKNRRPDKWRDKQPDESQSIVVQNIMSVPTADSVESWEEQAKKQQEETLGS